MATRASAQRPVARRAPDLDALIAVLGPRPYRSFEKKPKDEAGQDTASELIIALGRAREKGAVPMLWQIVHKHPDFRLRRAAADALLFFDELKILKGLIALLDFSKWDGGDFGSIAVDAVFKFDPKRAYTALHPAFDRAQKNPKKGNGIALFALQKIFFELVPPGKLIAEAEAERHMPKHIFSADRKRWIDACYALRANNYSTNQQIPTSVLRLTGDPRVLDAYFDGLAHNDLATVCRAVRLLDDPAAIPRLYELAKTAKEPTRSVVLETIAHLERPRKR